MKPQTLKPQTLVSWMIGVLIGVVIGEILFHTSLKAQVPWVIGNLAVMYIILALVYKND